MTQLIVAQIGTSFTEEKREELRKQITDQLQGCDVRVLLVPVGVCIQALPPLPFLSPIVPGPNPDQQDLDSLQRAAWRREYNALTPEERKQYGNFIGFVTDKGGADPYPREVRHIDTDEPEETVGLLPPHVWLYRNMLTELQCVAPLGLDPSNGQYAVALDDLTDEQRAIPYVTKQLEQL